MQPTIDMSAGLTISSQAFLRNDTSHEMHGSAMLGEIDLAADREIS